MTDKSHVAMEYAVCPICGEEHSVGILLDRKLQDSLPHKVVTHFKICPECQERIDNGYIALIEAEEFPDDPDKRAHVHEPNRTGRMVWLKKDAAHRLFNHPSLEEIAFISKEVYEALENLKVSNDEE